MRARRVAAGLIVCGALFAFQKPFRQYPGVEYDDFPLPKDWSEKAEFVFARMMYPPAPGVRGGGYRGYRSDWRGERHDVDPGFIHARTGILRRPIFGG